MAESFPQTNSVVQRNFIRSVTLSPLSSRSSGDTSENDDEQHYRSKASDVPPKSEEGRSGIIDGKRAEDESASIIYGNDRTKVEIDMPLTKYATSEDNGVTFFVLSLADGDAENPFNWSDKKKAFIAVVLCLMALFIGLATTAYSSGIGSMVADLNTTEELGHLGLSCFSMTCAVAPLILAPYRELFGRRLIYAGSFVCFCIMSIGLVLGNIIATILVRRTLFSLFDCVGTIYEWCFQRHP